MFTMPYEGSDSMIDEFADQLQLVDNIISNIELRKKERIFLSKK